MFAPILYYCPIMISKINKSSVKECDLVSKQDKMLYSTKIRYVGKKTLEPYLYSLLEEKDVSFFNKQLFETHIYLTNSIEKLIHHKIVHFDIKEDNIMFDNKQYLPIMIDFGLSFRIDLLKSDVDYKKAFIIFVSTCTWWCLEISIISFVVCGEYKRFNKKTGFSSSWMKDNIDMNHLLYIVDDYYSNNSNMNMISIYWQKEVESSKQKWKDYITNTLYKKDSNQYTKKTGEEIVKAFMQSWDTWDMFALSFLYLSFLQKLCIDCFKDYQDFLVHYILAVPGERIDLSEYYNHLVQFSEKYVDLDIFTFNKDEYIKKNKKNKQLITDLETKINQGNK
jgi:serine/threonine protein kinase